MFIMPPSSCFSLISELHLTYVLIISSPFHYFFSFYSPTALISLCSSTFFSDFFQHSSFSASPFPCSYFPVFFLLSEFVVLCCKAVFLHLFFIFFCNNLIGFNLPTVFFLTIYIVFFLHQSHFQSTLCFLSFVLHVHIFLSLVFILLISLSLHFFCYL